MDETDHPATQRCFACGGAFEPVEGPAHKYMLSTPGCWAAYGRLLAREYENPALFGAAHRLTVDAYALQHPGDPGDRRAVQSIWVHYAALHLAIERLEPHGAIAPVMQRLVGQKLAGRDFVPPGHYPEAFAITHADVLAAEPEEHVAAVRRWAECAWQGWSHLRAPVQEMLASI